MGTWDHLRSDESWGGFIGLSTELYSWLWFITMKGYDQISKAKRHMGWSLRETRCQLPRILFQWATQVVLNSPSNEFWQHVWNVHRKFIRDSVPRVFIGALYIICRHPLTSKTCTKASVHINHIVCINSEPLLLEIQFPATSQPCRKAFLSISTSVCFVNSFLYSK